jgi:hypothetical protein
MSYSDMFLSVSKRNLQQQGHWDHGFESLKAWIFTHGFRCCPIMIENFCGPSLAHIESLILYEKEYSKCAY